MPARASVSLTAGSAILLGVGAPLTAAFVPTLRIGRASLSGSDVGSTGTSTTAAVSSTGVAPAALGATAAALGVVASLGRASTRRLTRSATQAPEAAEAAEVAPEPFNPSKQLGAMEPLGYFDPLCFCKIGDEQGFRKIRASELKHGRVAMMASIGALGQPVLKLPWFENVTGTFGAMNTGQGVLGFVGLFAACGVLELAWRESEDKEPGNFGDPFGVNMYNKEMRLKEINNGRMAMISVLGIFAAEVVSGKNALEQFGL